MQYALVLHTEAIWDPIRRLKGQQDVGLSEKGCADAEALIPILRPLPIARIITSDLIRARQTAEIINRIFSLPLFSDQGLRECSFGSLEGLTNAQAIASYGSGVTTDWNAFEQAYDFTRFGGEHREQVLARHLEAFKRDVERGSEKSMTLVIGHSLGLHTLLHGLKYDPKLERGEYKIIDFSSI